MLSAAVMFPEMFGEDPYDIDEGWVDRRTLGAASIVLDRNLVEIDPKQIHKAGVLMTMMDGKSGTTTLWLGRFV